MTGRDQTNNTAGADVMSRNHKTAMATALHNQTLRRVLKARLIFRRFCIVIETSLSEDTGQINAFSAIGIWLSCQPFIIAR
jgi:hypothetical protein